MVLHLAVISYFTLYIKARGDPAFYGWLNIVGRQDLFSESRRVIFPEGVNFSSHSIRKKYFFSSPSRLYSDKEGSDLGFFRPKFAQLPPLGNISTSDNYFYLWQKPAVFPSREEETVSYRVYVSPYGKILFLYPEKLPVNSYGNLHLQEYLRGAAFFLEDRFFWTKLEGVVK